MSESFTVYLRNEEKVLLMQRADGVSDFLLEDLLRYEKTLDKIRDYGTI